MIYKYELFSETKVNKNIIDSPDTFKRDEINLRDYIPEEFKHITDEEMKKLNKGEIIFVTTITTTILEVIPIK